MQVGERRVEETCAICLEPLLMEVRRNCFCMGRELTCMGTQGGRRVERTCAICLEPSLIEVGETVLVWNQYLLHETYAHA